jgi:hypothetical protein
MTVSASVTLGSDAVRKGEPSMHSASKAKNWRIHPRSRALAGRTAHNNNNNNNNNININININNINMNNRSQPKHPRQRSRNCGLESNKSTARRGKLCLQPGSPRRR